MSLMWFYEDAPQYVSRGDRILSILDGSGSVEIIPGRPDVPADSSDFAKRDGFDPDIDFDPNSFSRMDKFDGLEVGQHLIDSSLDVASGSTTSNSSEEK
ncbi:hypothetical protein [Dipodfec virus UOA04_Rod_653]|nr:hypothetical protein [Dipodfec virus UOA04_Rod_653]